MKKLYIFSFLLILLASNIFSQSGWFQIMFQGGSSFHTFEIVDTNIVMIPSTSYVFYRSTNGGINWTESITPPGSAVTGIDFVNSLTGFTCALNGQIRKTTNGGGSWINTEYCINCSFYDIQFTDSVTGYICGTSGRIIKTTNAGSNWFNLSSNVSGSLDALYFINNLTGLAAGSPGGNGVILKTTNGGSNWFTTYSGTVEYYTDIILTSQDTGYCVGLNNYILKTTNGGNNWYNQFTLSQAIFYSVSFINNQTGYATGSSGKIYRTSNGGTNWVLQQSPYNELFGCVKFINQNTGYITSYWYGYMFKTTNGGLTWLEPVNNIISQSFNLHQNYPNPFNPVTKIKFDIPLLRGVSEGRGVSTKVIIYDLLGREVTTLINEQLKPGTYSVDWDGSGFASGVYFYSFVTDDFVETKRMVLIK